MPDFVVYHSGVEVIVTTKENEAEMLQTCFGERDITEFCREEQPAVAIVVRRPLGVEEWQAIKARCGE